LAADRSPFALGGALTLALSLFRHRPAHYDFFHLHSGAALPQADWLNRRNLCSGGFTLCRQAISRILDALRFCRPRRPFSNFIVLLFAARAW